MKMRSFITTLGVILLISSLYFGHQYLDQQEVLTTTTTVQKEKIPADSSLYNAYYYPESTTGIVVQHKYYQLSYHPIHKQAEWVAYRLHPSHLSENSFKRPYFEIDSLVPGNSAHWNNYRNSNYDRGHLLPAGDRRFSYEAYHETFLTSNISPQNRSFNSGIWNRLEIQVRRWAAEKGELFIITGGVLQEGLETIGAEKVSVPKYFYKIIVGYDQGVPKSIAFLIPNQNLSHSIAEFITPISRIQEMTGISLFNQLPQVTEAQLKAPADYRFWGMKAKNKK